MRVDLGDWLGQYVYLTGSYEPATARLIAALVDRGDTVIDVGANAGFFSLLAASRVGASGRVLAFEPVPAVRAVLEANLRLNHMSHVALHAVALADRPGTLTLYEGPAAHRGLSSIRPLAHSPRTHEVHARPLDDWLPELPPVKLVKIDVEGAEHHVLAGMRALIERDAPLLVVEVTDAYLRKMGQSATLLFETLASLGYRMFVIGERQLVPMQRPPQAWDAQFNALFCHAARLPELQQVLRS
jgi:FkbM family methyltransferase